MTEHHASYSCGAQARFAAGGVGVHYDAEHVD
jgi:hypothetical protein